MKTPVTLSFAVPEVDTDEFQRLPDDVRADVDTLLIEFEQVNAAVKVNPALKALAARLDHRRGFRLGTLRQKYYGYVASGDWRVLVDHARLKKHQRPGAAATGERDVNLPKDFIEYLKGLFQSNQRKSEPAIRLLYRQWRAGDSIPGYGTWQEWFLEEHPFHPLPVGANGMPQCPPDLPRGWSKGNLRRYIPEAAELALARQGIAAARAYLPDVLTTREGLRPLECIMFDDVRTDFKILVPGYCSPVELNLLVAMDVATGMILRFGLRPGIQREDGVKDKLKLRDMKTLEAGILTNFGVPKHYKSIHVVENATAAIKEGTAMALAEISCKQIEVSRTMMINGTALFGGYKDKALGNPRGKAALESTFNLLHNEAGFLPGQTGRRYDAGPAELAGREGEAKALTRISNRFLTPHQRAALRMPFLNRDQARSVLEDLFRQMMTRDDHCMEGFQVVGEWRNARFQQWRSESDLLSLPEAERDLVEWRNPARRETPLERWQRLMEEVGGNAAFTKLHPGAVTRLYDDHAKKTIDNSEIVFRFGKETFAYRIGNVQHARHPLQNEMEVLCYFDREDMSQIHLTDGEGGYLGSIPRTRGARRLDKEALKVQFDEQRARLHELQDRVSRRMPQVAEEHLEAIQNNAAVLEDALANQQAVSLVPGAECQVPGAAPEFAAEIARAKLAEKVHARTEAARARALRNFKGDIGELAEQPAPETISPGLTTSTKGGETPITESASPVEDLSAAVPCDQSQPEAGSGDFSAEGLL